MNEPTPTEPAKAAPDITFRIHPQALLAMRLLQSKDESRYVLCGVHFEIQPRGNVLLIATNGRYIGILNADAIVTSNVKEVVEFTVDYPFARYLPKPGSHDFDKVIVHYDGKTVSFTSGDQTIYHKVIEGDYPKWRKIIPQTPFAPCEVSVNAEYVTTFHRVAKLLGGRDHGAHVILKGHERRLKPGESDAYAPYSVFMPPHNGEQFYGVIMPMRSDAVWEVPKWLEAEEPKPAPVPVLAQAPTNIPYLVPGTGGKYGKTFIGTSEAPPVGIGSIYDRKKGFSYWIEWGKWYEAPTVDDIKFGDHDYVPGPGDCKCGCHMGDASSSGPVDPFGACPLNPRPSTDHVTPAVAQADAQSEASERMAEAEAPPVPHPIIPPSTKVTNAQARKERKANVHKRNTRSGKNLDRSRRHRHGKKRKNLHVQR